MSAWEQAIATIAVALASALPCSLLGTFLLLRRMSLLADAVGHGILPGIALAAMFGSGPHGLGLLVGATLFGALTALLAEGLVKGAGVSEDSSLGVVFTGMFAFGVVLLSRNLANVHIDLHCVGMGLLELTPLEQTLGVPTAMFAPLGVGAVAGLFVAGFWKELKASTFDPGFASAAGLPARRLHLALVGLTAAATVAGFEAFGSILILGMFAIPPATARLFADRLGSTTALAALFATTACVGGYLVASPFALGCSASGAIVAFAGAQFACAFVAAPRHGLVASTLRRFRLARRIAGEEILAEAFRAEEAGRRFDAQTVRDHGLSRWAVAWAARSLRRKRLLADDAGGMFLTPAGKTAALAVVRAHRLWEAYLDRHFDLPLDHLHAPASQIEHFLGPEAVAELTRELDAPDRDPHGREIP